MKIIEIQQIRKYFTEYSTISEVFHDGRFVCFFLEDKDRMLDSSWDLERIKNEKVYGRTAIPTGRYRIEWTYSNRFKKPMPILLNVKGFEGIRIHGGVNADDSLGCLITGMKMTIDNVQGTQEAKNKIYTIIKTIIDNRDQVYLNITRKQ